VKIVILHGADALEPPADPVIAQVDAALRAAAHECATIAVGKSIEPVVHELKEAQADLVFNLTESFRDISSLDSNLAALLNLLDLRYTGSSPAGLILAGDKSLSKKVLRFHGIPTPNFATLYRGALDHAQELRFPVIVKPPQEDASIGISEASVVHDLASLLRRIDALQDTYRSPVLVEEFIPGREFYVGVLGNAHAEALPVIELCFSADDRVNPNRVASFEVKWDAARERETHSAFPTDMPADLLAKMQQVAVDVFQALRLRDYARIDLRLNERGEVFVIEANPNCYLECGSEFARAAGQAGTSYDDLIQRIVELAGARYAR
jgi:D-alanine-D-alanine ligase